MGRSVAHRIGSFVLSLTAGCGLFGGEEEPSIGLTPSATTAVVQQGSSLPITINVARTNFEGAVSLSVEGTLPSGVTATFTQNPVSASNASTTLNITASGTATPGTAALTVKATGEGVTEKAFLVDVTVNIRGSHTLALSNSSMNVAQGGGGQTTLLVARQNSNAGSVTLTATGAPAGMTVSFGESPTTASSTSLTVAATGSVAPGNYNISISGTQPGLTAPAPATLAVTVMSAPATTAMSIPFCSASMPAWFAYQNDGFLWQRVTATGTAFNFSATDKLAIAFAYTNGNASEVRFYFATRSELSGITDRDCAGPKNHPGTTANVGASQTAIVALGPSLELVSANAFLLEGVPDRPLDLIGARGTLTNSNIFTPDRVVLRRGVNLTNNSSIAQVDFTGGESVAPASNTLNIAALEAGETVYMENVFQGTTWTSGLIFSNQSTSNTYTMYSAPAASLVAGDIHEMYIDAFNSTGTVAHTMVTYFSAPGDRVETLGPLLTVPSITSAGSSPYVRHRGQLSSQTAYPTAARFTYLQGVSPAQKFVVLIQTAAYLGATPATWDVTVPDVANVAGFSTAWMHTAGTNTAYAGEAFSAPGGVLFGATPSVGQSVKFAFRQSSFQTSVGSALRAASGPRSSMRDARGGLLNPPPQYLRR